MLREFTKDMGKDNRYPKGSQHDFPQSTWDDMAKSAGLPLWRFTKKIANNRVLQNRLRGEVKTQQRLGSPK